MLSSAQCKWKANVRTHAGPRNRVVPGEVILAYPETGIEVRETAKFGRYGAAEGVFFYLEMVLQACQPPKLRRQRASELVLLQIDPRKAGKETHFTGQRSFDFVVR